MGKDENSLHHSRRNGLNKQQASAHAAGFVHAAKGLARVLISASTTPRGWK